MNIPALATFLFSLIVIYFIVRLSETVQKNITRFGDHLLLRAFPSFSDFEPYKFALLRILFGLILVSKTTYIQLLLIPEEMFTQIGLYSALGLASAILLTLGIFTQWLLLLHVFIIWHTGDSILGVGSLGSYISAILSTILFLTGAGKHISIDSFLMNKYWFIKKTSLYLKNDSAPENIALAKFVGLLAFGCLSIYSLSMHINEPAWMTGAAGPLLLTNNFMSSWYLFFESIFSSSQLSVHIVRLSLWVMMFWFLTIIPFTLIGGIFRLFVIIWGLLFFALAFIVLNLGSLAEIEILLWTAIFWSKSGLDSKQKVSIYFSDKNYLSIKTVQVIKLVDILGQSNIKLISSNDSDSGKIRILFPNNSKDLFGFVVETSKSYSGFDFYILISKCIVLLWPLFPVLYISKKLLFGPRIYRMIEHFFKRKNEGSFIYNEKNVRNLPEYLTGNKGNNLFHSAIVLHVIFLAGYYLISVPAPYIGARGAVNPITLAANYYGINRINVFNKADLKMAENWFTLESISHNEMVPLFTESGSRLSMHKSDRVYFGNTLRYRRGSIDKNQCAFKDQKLSIEYLSKVYLHLKNAKTGNFAFKYVQHFQPLSNMDEIVKGKYRKQKRLIKCTILFDVSYSI